MRCMRQPQPRPRYERSIEEKADQLLKADLTCADAHQREALNQELSELVKICRHSYYKKGIALLDDERYDQLQDMQYEIRSLLGARI